MNKTLCKLVLVLPLVLFMDWIIMAVFGSFAGACHAKNHFFCSAFCYCGVLLVILSVTGGCYFVLRKAKTDRQ